MHLATTDSLKVLIVDDSLVFRSAITRALSGTPHVEVVGSVRNGAKAMEFIQAAKPDIVSLDLEMPDMDGIETLAAIQQWNADHAPERPIGVIMLSSHTQRGAESTLRALELGAFDFVPKPVAANVEESIGLLSRQLVTKMRHFNASRARVAPAPTAPPKPETAPVVQRPAPPSRRHSTARAEAVVIGVSTGGPRALITMLPRLVEQVRIPILIVQHMPPGFTHSLAKSLDVRCASTVLEASDNMPVQVGHVYIAPGGNHMIVARENGQTFVRIVGGPPENGCKPAADTLFRSAGSVYGDALVAVILTGMGSDGAKAAAVLRKQGARVIAQDEASSVVWGMPGAAVAAGAVDDVASLTDIPNAVAAATGIA